MGLPRHGPGLGGADCMRCDVDLTCSGGGVLQGVLQRTLARRESRDAGQSAPLPAPCSVGFTSQSLVTNACSGFGGGRVAAGGSGGAGAGLDWEQAGVNGRWPRPAPPCSCFSSAQQCKWAAGLAVCKERTLLVARAMGMAGSMISQGCRLCCAVRS